MVLFKKVEELKAYLAAQRAKGMKVGYAPTMGALHQGHASLIKKAKAENDISVCSIFVNPTQFNDPADLEKYPRTESQDMTLLESLKNNVLFYPCLLYTSDAADE